MRLDALHRRVVMDARVLQDAVSPLLSADIPHDYDGRTFNISTLIKRLNTLTEPFGVFNRIQNDKKTTRGTIEMSAEWFSEREKIRDPRTDADIYVEWYVHPCGHRVKLSATQWKEMVYRFWFYITHEMVHRHQNVHRAGGTAIEPEHPNYNRARKFRARSEKQDIADEQKYLGDYDEIEAFAQGAAFEMLVWYPKLGFRDVVNKVSTNTTPLGMPTYQWYLSFFKDTPHHPAITIFKRKVTVWYKMMVEDNDFYQSLELAL